MDRNNIVSASFRACIVALRKESVDRNKIRIAPIDRIISVALRKESVDRNCYLDKLEITQAVALRKESVDRNC